jgi:signal transduction histidine kinase
MSGLTSLFRKTMIFYICIVALAFATLSVVLNVEIRHFLAGQRLVVLNREATELLPLLENGKQLTLDTTFEQLVAHDKSVDNTSVNILLLNNGDGLNKVKKLTNYFINHDQIRNVKAVRRILKGQRIQYTGTLSTTNRETRLIVGLPILRNGKVAGALFLHTAFKELQLLQITKIIFLIALLVLALSIGILYTTTRRFSRPLARITGAVQSFGRGNFKERLPVESQDEVGQLAETFNDMASRLEKLETMRKDLIANVSHELRTPLTSVGGFIQGIMEGVIPPTLHQQYLATAHQELLRLGTILNTMLDLSAIETGHIELHLEAVNWLAIVQSVRDKVILRMNEKGIAWRESRESQESRATQEAHESWKSQESHSEEPIRLWGDSERITQILFNLLDNAIRHTESGEITVASSVVGKQLHVKISDTGEGIPPEVLPHIWERFYSRRSSQETGQHQSGLGLTITKHLVELMQGRIDVESAPAQGTTFTLRFPLLDSHTDWAKRAKG